MVQTILVRWKNSAANPVTFFSALTGQPINGDISVKERTQFEFKADSSQSDPQFQGFTIHILPNAPDIKIDTASGSSVSFTNTYARPNVRIPLNMTVKTNHDSFVITGGKPIIRNEPRHPFANPAYMTGAIIALLVVAVIVYFAFFH
jgi:hypothetical protein